jgi:hypothetical protein
VERERVDDRLLLRCTVMRCGVLCRCSVTCNTNVMRSACEHTGHKHAHAPARVVRSQSDRVRPYRCDGDAHNYAHLAAHAPICASAEQGAHDADVIQVNSIV